MGRKVEIITMRTYMQLRLLNKYSEFLKASGLQYIAVKDAENDAEYSRFGCECCDNGLGNNLYECVGVTTDTDEEIDGIMLCADCTAYFSNGGV